MREAKQCLRCRKSLETGILCQTCKSELIPFFEATKDWNLAIEMESAHRSIKRYKPEPDNNNYSF